MNICKPFSVILVFIALSFPLSAKQPNILFIFTDDHSHRAVGCYPESPDWVKTPHIDSLAKNGIRFANCYMGSWCMGARATLLTGFQTYGIKSMRMKGKYPGSVYDSSKSPFWPAVFRKNGYQTAQVGKWHTGTDNGYGRDWDFQKVWNRPAFPENSGNYFKEQLIQTNGKKAVMTQGYSTDNYTKWAEEYIRGGHGKKKGKPFYLWVCYGAVHGPFTPAPRHLEKYPEVKVEIPPEIYPPRIGKPKYSREKEQWIRGKNGLPVLKNKRFSGRTVSGKFIHGIDLHSLERQYHQGVLAIDDGVGKLIKALKDTGQYENTLIVFGADQGIAWGQKGFQMKLAPYDGTIRGPLIVSMPKKLPCGKVCEKPVGGADLVPTFFEAAKLQPPWKMHGRDLTPLLNNPTDKSWNSPLLLAHTGMSFGEDCDEIIDMKDDPIYQKQEVPWWVFLRTNRYKYIRNLLPGETEELYDMKNDPEELVNLAANKKNLSLVRKLRARTIKELEKTDCKFALKMPPVLNP